MCEIEFNVLLHVALQCKTFTQIAIQYNTSHHIKLHQTCNEVENKTISPQSSTLHCVGQNLGMMQCITLHAAHHIAEKPNYDTWHDPAVHYHLTEHHRTHRIESRDVIFRRNTIW